MSAAPMSSVISDAIRNRFACWVAHVNVTAPKYAYRYDMWQYSCKGKIPGINGDVDLDYCYVDYPTLIKTKGLNGWAPETTTPVRPETKEISLTIDGVTWKGTLRRAD
jgi:GH25 family lysozyme M1 (1,4-beta-N-acetylmuramidase)